MLRPLIFATCAIWMAAPATCYAQVPDPPTRTFLAAPISVRAPGLETFVKAYHDGERIYVDVEQMLTLLGFTVVRDGALLTAADAKRRFSLNYDRRSATLGSAPPVLLVDALQYSDGVYLVTVAGLRKVLDPDVTWDAARLTLRLSTSATRFSPAALGQRRFLGGEVPGPLLYGLDRRLVGGAVVAWQATSQWRRGRAFHNTAAATYTLNMLGGALQGAISTSAHGNNISYTHARPHSLLLTRVEVGTEAVRGVRRTRGVRMSNLPLVTPHVQRTSTVRGEVEPHAMVEVLAGGQVTDRTQADEIGRYRLRVPAYYGTTEVVTRVSPLGGIAPYERREYIFTTQALAAHKRLYYDAAYGEEDAHALIRYGVTPRVTAHGAWGGRSGYRVGLSASPAPSIVLDAEAGWPLHVAALSATWSRRGIRAHGAYASAQKAQHRQLGASAQWGRLGAHLTATAHHSAQGITSRQASSTASYHARSGVSLRQQLKVVADHGIVRTTWRSVLGFTRSTHSAGLHINAFAHDDGRVRAGGEVLIGYRRIFVGLNAAYTPSTRAIAGHVTVQVRTRAGTVRSYMDSQGAHTYTAHGTASVWPGVRFGDGASNDTAAILRVFRDRNRNGRKDPEDPILDDVDVDLWHATVARRGDGTLEATHLAPYAAYQVTIQERSIRDPLLRPAQGYTFSFIAAPGHTKLIDIALQRLPLVRGRVRTAALATSRLRVVALRGAEAVATAPVYRDGGFSLRLEGGAYLLRVEDVVEASVVVEQPLEVPRSARTLNVEIIF